MGQGKITVASGTSAEYDVLISWDLRRVDAQILVLEEMLSDDDEKSLNTQITNAQADYDAAKNNFDEQVDVVKDIQNTLPVDTQALASAIIELTRRRGEMDSAKVSLDVLTNQKLSLEKTLAFLQEYKPPNEISDAKKMWCADYTLDLAVDDDVATCEINGERIAGQLIRARTPPHNPFVELMNQHRLDNNLNVLYADYRLAAAAQRMAEDFAKTGALSHTASDDSTPLTRARDAGYPLNPVVENIGEVLTLNTNNINGILAFNNWLNSPGHNAVMLNALFTHYGAAYGFSEESGNHTFVCVFGFIDHLLKTADRHTPGKLQPAVSNTPAGAVNSFMLLTGWQKWGPTYRVGRITKIDKPNNKADVLLDNAVSALPRLSALTAHDVEINQSNTLTDIAAAYMQCDMCAFNLNDRVLVEFQGQDWNYPYIVGFESNPRPCGIWFTIYREDGVTIKPNMGIFVDVRLQADDPEGGVDTISSGTWDTVFKQFNGELSYDTERQQWLIITDPITPQRYCGQLYVQVITDNSIATVYPYKYKTADKYQEEDQVAIGDELDIRIPYWKLEVTAGANEDFTGSSHFNGVTGRQAYKDVTVYSSVSYVLKREWGGTLLVEWAVIEDSLTPPPFYVCGTDFHNLTSVPGGIAVYHGTGRAESDIDTKFSTSIGFPSTTSESIVTGTDYNRFGATLNGRTHYWRGIHNSDWHDPVTPDCDDGGPAPYPTFDAPFNNSIAWYSFVTNGGDTPPGGGGDPTNRFDNYLLIPHWENWDAFA